jgi:hypothetical protein
MCSAPAELERRKTVRHLGMIPMNNAAWRFIVYTVCTSKPSTLRRRTMQSIYSTTRFPWAAQFVLSCRRLLADRQPVPQTLRLGGNKGYRLPRFVRKCALTMETIERLRLLEWSALSPQPSRRWFGRDPVPQTAYIAAYLIKLDQRIPTTAQLRRFLVDHPSLVWSLGFPLVPANHRHGFDADASLPTARHFNRMLRELPNAQLQRLLDAQVSALQTMLPPEFGQTISLDTKHILAWVKENNPKQYIKGGRFHKDQQPAGDPDCKLGCKRRHNRQERTPTREGQPASGLPASIGEFYWGYGSGIVAAKVDGWGEFVLAEITQTFDKGDATYFFPLMAEVERRLGRKPRYGALDAAFDAFYVYDYFHDPEQGGFAAVPFSAKGGKPNRRFDEAGLPLCDAGLAMPLKSTYMDRTTTIIPYRRAKHVCPLLYPEACGQTCPIEHKQWAKGGCTTHIADSVGSRIRHQLDRSSPDYTEVYRQRTATERIFAQALTLGIERPKLRNQRAIANQNTLIYLLINLRAMKRIQEKLAILNR